MPRTFFNPHVGLSSSFKLEETRESDALLRLRQLQLLLVGRSKSFLFVFTHGLPVTRTRPEPTLTLVICPPTLGNCRSGPRPLIPPVARHMWPRQHSSHISSFIHQSTSYQPGDCLLLMKSPYQQRPHFDLGNQTWNDGLHATLCVVLVLRAEVYGGALPG
ncbi:hypothetical protein GALMADRAFT_1125300 [Galerina marginata CBS 339.88]|uniref:Uncharacterized protein n=1 Tax=Galerina marginata (strain CBS 339.88) TaxID=685588 RepID=A0A067TDJ5_GALM3|nr:hypothetical protein GALMADRAFT_1125300 [Galerina marginata CBS 339.88]